MIINRHKLQLITDRLNQFPAVALLGPRQVGKTTLAQIVARKHDSIYLDLEKTSDRVLLSDAEYFLTSHEDKLVIIDEIHRTPELFQTLRGLIDSGRRRGIRTKRFLLLGSASIELIRQSGESLAGRIAYVELPMLNVGEVGADSHERLWIRGGFPDSFLAVDDAESSIWRNNFIGTYLERDIPSFGPRIPAETLRRLWTMLSHNQSGLLNSANLARSMMVDAKTIGRYIDLLVDLLLARRLQPYLVNVGKRLVKSPKIFIRDSGVVHSLLGLETREDVMSHPVAGGSWEGFVIENLLGSTSERVSAYFYRTAAGAEVDLVLEMPGSALWAIEIKRGLSPTVSKGLHYARQDLNPERTFVVYAGDRRYPKSEGIEVIGLREMLCLLAEA